MAASAIDHVYVVLFIVQSLYNYLSVSHTLYYIKACMSIVFGKIILDPTCSKLLHNLCKLNQSAIYIFFKKTRSIAVY